MRKLLPGSTDVYESIKMHHSWNAPQTVSNYMLFKLQRHSDHHANVYKPYQILDTMPDTPILPYGYAVCMILALIPPIWRRVIDPIAIATNKGEKVSKEVEQDQLFCIKITILCSSILITALNFHFMGYF